MNSATVKVVLPLDWPFIGGKTIIIRKKLLIALLLFGLTFKYGVPNLHYIFMYIQLIISKIYQKVIKSIVALSRKRKSRRNDEMVPSEEGKITATVTLTNIDWWMHMNNATYLRYAELGRVDYFISTKMRPKLRAHGYGLGFVGVNIRYRREIRFNTKFLIKTRAVFWDETTLIMEQKFCDISNGFVYTLIFGKYVLIDLKTKRKAKFENLPLDINDTIENNNNNNNGNKNNNKNNNNGVYDAIYESQNRQRVGFYKLDWYSSEDDEKMEVLPSNARITQGRYIYANNNNNNNNNNNDENKDQTIENKNDNGDNNEQCQQSESSEQSENNNVRVDKKNNAMFLKKRQNTSTIDFVDNYQCRNDIPHSLVLWMQSLEQSSIESRRNLLDLS